jgi:hypothetical protein
MGAGIELVDACMTKLKLSVASNGGLTGTPLSADVGTNSFTVRANDTSGLSSTATMNLVVLPATPTVISVAWQGNDLQLNWTGGIAPYQVQFTTNLPGPTWQNLGPPVSDNSVLLSPTNGAALYRVFGR